MSKTFKALQRAARERDGRLADTRPEGEAPEAEAPPPAPAPGGGDPLAGGAADASTTAGGGAPRDEGLVSLLVENLAPADPRRPMRVTGDGRVLGDPDRESARTLLARYALLHCLRERSGDAWTWFWASGPEARDRASREGLLLDADGLA